MNGPKEERARWQHLLFGVSKSPAMLQFLNNRQNRKRHPNENFGRGVRELFTLGRGRYSGHGSPEDYIKPLIINLVSMPGYPLC